MADVKQRIRPENQSVNYLILFWHEPPFEVLPQPIQVSLTQEPLLILVLQAMLLLMQSFSFVVWPPTTSSGFTFNVII